MSLLRSALQRRMREDGGFTLIELLVGLVLTSLVTSMVFTAVMAASRVAKSSRNVNDLNEEARLVLNRMSRELREARDVTAVTNPAGPGGGSLDSTGDVSLTFEVDFNGNGVIEPNASDPEVLTYVYDRSGQRLLLQAAGESLPVLAAKVADFTVDFTTRRYQYDGVQFTTGAGCTSANQTKDGVVHWYEVDKYPGSVGNCNGLLDAELPVIDSVQIDLKVLYGPQQQVYRTTVDMRNSAG
jgi:prepilin-type N-terminal cleavage/methylation domain-containing protein